MKFAIYGREFNNTVLPYVQDVFDALEFYGIEILVFRDYFEFIAEKVRLPEGLSTFTGHQDLCQQADVLISLGGDGTLLDTLALVRDSAIPVIGINFGRLGFLASINKDNIKAAIAALMQKDYSLDQRTLLHVESKYNLFGDENFALNDITIHRRDNSAMMIIHAYMDDEFINSYWADGLIIATPTGSTAYSLSCGGPIIFPSAQNFVITPIAPHNLNVRPVIIPDNVTLRFEVEARSTKFLVSCDSRTATVDRSVKITVKKAEFHVNLIRLHKESYLTTLRNKLLWGIDTRNY
ncbi:NAD kinase [Pedobacter antarcticus]|uniref:NAD kinase n=2 Tax=Pedobacter antarcticus TaxID=34086 RepID=A0A081PI79_9SPHI|nr:NAD kinase [Pedobacter antarcticus]KEQ30402.1 inorganic polyphosphate kinase [Pedobacter antarcticus 4BY]SDM08029.1 NAD+ kinase [Pedobacter antarcticus]SFF41602.1 NAD+ kinase [Pedobacter antarcticus]